jgi:hypothetical protein
MSSRDICMSNFPRNIIDEGRHVSAVSYPKKEKYITVSLLLCIIEAG